MGGEEREGGGKSLLVDRYGMNPSFQETFREERGIRIFFIWFLSLFPSRRAVAVASLSSLTCLLSFTVQSDYLFLILSLPVFCSIRKGNRTRE